MGIGPAATSLSSDAFLKLFVTQLQHQDPDNPMDPSQMISQLATLTNVQKLGDLSTTFSQALHTEKMSLAQGMMGKEVSFKYADQIYDGVVQGAEISNGAVGVKINGSFIPLDDVTEIRAAETAQSTTAAS